MTLKLRQAWGLVWGLGAASLLTPALAAPTYSVKDMMAYVPKQRDVEYETPKPEEYAKCKLEVERRGKGSGWVVLGPSGQVLRKFLDTQVHQLEEADAAVIVMTERLMSVELKGRWYDREKPLAGRQKRLRAQISPPTVDGAAEVLYLATASGEIVQMLPLDEDEPTQLALDE